MCFTSSIVKEFSPPPGKILVRSRHTLPHHKLKRRHSQIKEASFALEETVDTWIPYFERT